MVPGSRPTPSREGSGSLRASYASVKLHTHRILAGGVVVLRNDEEVVVICSVAALLPPAGYLGRIIPTTPQPREQLVEGHSGFEDSVDTLGRARRVASGEEIIQSLVRGRVGPGGGQEPGHAPGRQERCEQSQAGFFHSVGIIEGDRCQVLKKGRRLCLLSSKRETPAAPSGDAGAAPSWYSIRWEC